MHEHFLQIWDEFFIGMKTKFYNLDNPLYNLIIKTISLETPVVFF